MIGDISPEVKKNFIDLNFDIKPFDNADAYTREILSPPKGIYKIIKTDSGYDIKLTGDWFSTPDRVFGKTGYEPAEIWNDFAESETSIGGLFDGDSGTGKTNYAKIISNYALLKGLPVINLSKIEINIELIEYISRFNNAVLYIDEFDKCFKDVDLQNRLLDVLCDPFGYKRLGLLTTNNRRLVSNFIMGRTERIKYLILFGKLEANDVIDYCAAHNVDEKYIEDILTARSKAAEFSYDNLITLVKEHKRRPNKTFEEIVSVLNLPHLRIKTRFKVVRAIKKVNDEITELEGAENKTYSLEDIEAGVYFHLMFKTKKTKDNEDKPFPSYHMNSPFYVGVNKTHNLTWSSDDNTIIVLTNSDGVELTFQAEVSKF